MFQLHQIQQADSIYAPLLVEDPVRPHIPHWKRFGHNLGMFVLTSKDNGEAQALCCYALIGKVPEDEEELFLDYKSFNVAVFYTVWARKNSIKGAGRTIINDALSHIHWFVPSCERAVTLSPKTEMARRFHTSNGAFLFRENETTINYEYPI